MPTTALSYEEISERFGISLPSARRMVHRRKWKKTKGNDGRAVVQVPNEFIDSHQGKHRGRHDDARDDDHSARHDDKAAPRDNARDQSALVADVMARLVTAQENAAAMARKLGVAEGEIVALKAQADEARSTIVELTGKANRVDTLDALLQTEKQRLDEWKAVADRFALQAEKLAASRRGWWPFRRSA
jgi:hypothetical protein